MSDICLAFPHCRWFENSFLFALQSLMSLILTFVHVPFLFLTHDRVSVSPPLLEAQRPYTDFNRLGATVVWRFAVRLSGCLRNLANIGSKLVFCAAFNPELLPPPGIWDSAVLALKGVDTSKSIGVFGLWAGDFRVRKVFSNP